MATPQACRKRAVLITGAPAKQREVLQSGGASRQKERQPPNRSSASVKEMHIRPLLASIPEPTWSYAWWRDIGSTTITGFAAVVVAIAALVVAIVSLTDGRRHVREQRAKDDYVARKEVARQIQLAVEAHMNALRPPKRMTMTLDDPGHDEWSARRRLAGQLYRQAVIAISTLPPNARDGALRILTEACSYPRNGQSTVTADVPHEEQRGMSGLGAALPLWLHDPVAFGNAAPLPEQSDAGD